MAKILLYLPALAYHMTNGSRCVRTRCKNPHLRPVVPRSKNNDNNLISRCNSSIMTSPEEWPDLGTLGRSKTLRGRYTSPPCRYEVSISPQYVIKHGCHVGNYYTEADVVAM
jgi:hypothetical protein